LERKGEALAVGRMDNKKKGIRDLKGKLRDLLRSDNFDQRLNELCKLRARQVINPLFSFLCSIDELIKWRAVTAMCAVVANLADEDMESARVIMRRLMWQLNDESGGIGWGCPETMGEIMACHEGLAKEYAHILISYTRPEGNYLEHEGLQRGLLWGIGRLSQVRPELVKDAAQHLIAYLKSPDATVRGLAAWIMGLLEVKEARLYLEQLTDDKAEIQIYIDRRFIENQVKELAEEALKKLPS
jgi:hypothetical protein